MGPFTVRHSGNVRAARSQVWSFRVFVNGRGFEIRRDALMVFDEEKESFRWSTCPGTRRHTLRLFPTDSAVLPLLLLFCKHSSHLVVFPAPCTHQSAVRSTDCKLFINLVSVRLMTQVCLARLHQCYRCLKNFLFLNFFFQQCKSPNTGCTEAFPQLFHSILYRV